MLERAEMAARGFDSRIGAVNASITDELQDVWIGTSDGRWLHDHRPLISMGVQAVSTGNRERAQGFVGDGGRTSIAYYETRSPESLGIEAARIVEWHREAQVVSGGDGTQ